MAVTIVKQPSSYMPAYSPQKWVATSNQTANTDFSYIITVTDLLSGEFQKYVSPADINGKLFFDSMNFAKDWITRYGHYIPMNVYNFKRSNSIRKIRVNIGEYYGGAEHSGSNVDYIVWNGVLPFRDYPSYNTANYLYTALTSKILNSSIDEDTFTNRSNYLYMLSNVQGELLGFRVKAYDIGGGLLGTSEFVNPFYNDPDYYDRYFCIDVGLKGLAGISSGDVSGTYPIIPFGTAYYTIEDKNAGFTIGTYVYNIIKTYRVKEECLNTVYSVHFLNKNGAFETCHFSKRSDKEVNKNTSFYRVNPFVYDNSFTYDPSTSTERVLNVDEQEILTLNTDWLSDAKMAQLRDLLSSPICYLDLGTSDFYPVRVLDDTLNIKKKVNEKLFQLTMRFQLNNQEYRQQS